MSTSLISKHTFPIIRRSGNYKPCIHRDNNMVQSLNTDYTVEDFKEQVEMLKRDVVDMFNAAIKPIDLLELVSDLQRLGLAYHFEQEIKSALNKIYDENQTNYQWQMDDLHTTSLKFTLLRRHGYDISEDVFKRFMENGNFKEELFNDVKGMLSLYEAYYISSEGESLMEVAWSFTSKTLRKHLEADSTIDPNLSEKVRHALRSPLDWRMPRMEARWYIDVYGRSNNMKPALLELAKLDYNIVQGIYQEDLKNVSRSWEELGLAKKLSFARDRLVESFIWALAFAAPELRYTRMQIAKQVQMITYIDDIYDVYGTLDEVELFTDAVERWDINSIQLLPDYMKICFLALYNFVNETVYQIYKEQNIDVLPYLRRAWANLVKSYLVEARWYHGGCKPTLEEYLRNGKTSIGSPVCFLLSYICSTNPITREALQFIEDMPDIISSAAELCRILDDNGTSSHELARGDVPKVIQCYMSDTASSEDAAHAHMRGLMKNKWRQMNKCRLEAMPVPLAFVDNVYDSLRAFHYIYRDGDGFSIQHESKSKFMLKALIVEPVPM